MSTRHESSCTLASVRVRFMVLSVLLALVAVPASARADRWAVADVERAMAVADAHWLNSSCFGRHDLHWTTGAELDALFPPPAGIEPMARGEQGGCEVWIAWDRFVGGRMGLVSLCSVLMHEYGHNAGYQHSDDMRDAMFYAAGLQRDCSFAFRPRAYAARHRHPH